MTSEIILLLVISFIMLTHILTGVTGTFKTAIPRLAVRVEKHLITGYIFSKKAGRGHPALRVIWQEF